MTNEWNTTTKYIVSVGLTLFGIFLLYISRSVLALLVVAALIAFLLMPLVNFFQRRLKLPRGVAVLITYLLATIVILLLPLVFIPPVVDGFQYLAGIDYQLLIDTALERVEAFLLTLKGIDAGVVGLSVNLDGIIDPALALLQEADTDITPALPSLDTLVNSLRSALTTTFGLATDIAGSVFSGVLTFIVTILAAIYLSLDAHKFKNQFLDIVPEAYRSEMAMLIRRLGRMWRAYFRGQIILMISIGVITWIGNMILGLPGAFALGVIAGVLELIPNLGPFLAAIPAVIVALLQGPIYLGVNNLVFALIIIGFYILVQQLENTLIVPRILGEAVDLHPLVVMTGVLIGANVAGILGALLAAPVIASGREIIRYLYLKVLGQDPFPPEEETLEETQLSLLVRLGALLAGLRTFLARWRQLKAPPIQSSQVTVRQDEMTDEPTPEN